MACSRILLAFLGALLVSGFAGCSDSDSRPEGTRLKEEIFVRPASHIFLSREGAKPEEFMERVLLVQKELDSGTPFAEVARKRSDNRDTAVNGGFIGFFRPDGSGELSGAIQALPPGVTSHPVDTKAGTQFVLRHTFEEGRALEQEYYIPVYGFFIPWDPGNRGGIKKDEARARAENAAAKIASGEMTLAEANKAFGIHEPARPDYFIASVTNHGAQAPVYQLVKDVPEGGVAPLYEVDNSFGVIKRASYFRSFVRHILIQHLKSSHRNLSVTRSRQDAEKLAKEVLAEALRDKAKWSELVRQYTDEVDGLALDGSLGVRTNGDMIAEFEKAVLATPVGEIHDELVTTPEGFHIVWRVR